MMSLLDETASRSIACGPDPGTIDMETVQPVGTTKTIVLVARRLTTVKDCDIFVVVDKRRSDGTGRCIELFGDNQAFRLTVQMV